MSIYKCMVLIAIVICCTNVLFKITLENFEVSNKMLRIAIGRLEFIFDSTRNIKYMKSFYTIAIRVLEVASNYRNFKLDKIYYRN